MILLILNLTKQRILETLKCQNWSHKTLYTVLSSYVSDSDNWKCIIDYSAAAQILQNLSR